MKYLRLPALAAILLAILGIYLTEPLADKGPLTGLQGQVSAWQSEGYLPKVVYYGDSWFHNQELIYGAESSLHAPVAKPYSWASGTADPTSTMQPVFCEQLSRRLGTPLWASNSVGSMELKIASGGTEQDSSIFGMIDGDLDADIVIFPGGGGFNDLFAGDTYATIRQEMIDVTQKILMTHKDAWVVALSPRPIGMYLFTRQSGADHPARRGALRAEYDLMQKFRTFVADTLRNEVKSIGAPVGRFVTFDAHDYGSAFSQPAATREADTAGVVNSIFYSTHADTYLVYDDIEYSPLYWYQVEKDSHRVHLNDYGNKSYADSIAQYCFGITLDNSYTKGTGTTIYTDIDNGDNWGNRLKCNSPNYPLATLWAGVSHANPGDIVRVSGSGNQAVLAYDTTTTTWISPNSFEFRLTKPGITIYLEDGASFTGNYNSSTITTYWADADLTTSGYALMDRSQSTAETQITDSLAQYSVSDVATAQPVITADLVIEGQTAANTWLSGYQVPWISDVIDEVHFKTISITGGESDYSIDFRNFAGGKNTLNMTGVTVNHDSAAVSAGTNTGSVRLYQWDNSAEVAITTATGFDGTFRECWFRGDPDTEVDEPAVYGRMQGFDFIECAFTDSTVNGNAAWLDTGTFNTVTNYGTVRFINCSWVTPDSSSAAPGVYTDRVVASEDSVIFVNCVANFSRNAGVVELFDVAGTSAEHANLWVEAINCTLGEIELQGGDANLVNEVVTNGRTVNCLITSYITFPGDSSYWSGEDAYGGYDMSEDFGINHARNHVSLGPTQYMERPTATLGSTNQIADYAELSLGELQVLINNGVIASVDTTDIQTYFRFVPADANEELSTSLFLEEYGSMLQLGNKTVRVKP